MVSVAVGSPAAMATKLSLNCFNGRISLPKLPTAHPLFNGLPNPPPPLFSSFKTVAAVNSADLGSPSSDKKMATASLGVDKLLQIGTKIIGVGRNYAAHAKELGNPVPKEPVLFLKPTSSYLSNGGTILIPHTMESLHYEVELAVVIGRTARDVPQSAAMDYVGGYALALDMTAREIQAALKSEGLPWTLAKGQDTFAPISTVLPTSSVHDPDNVELWLKVDGEIRQKGTTKDMIFKLPYLISHISSIMTLFEGDVIFTGTPEGAGPVKAGQKITAGITDVIDVHFNVEKRAKPVIS